MEKSLACRALAAMTLAFLAANYRTENFVVQAATPALAQQVAKAAEAWRRHLAVEWLGKELPRWTSPCHVTVQAGTNLAPNGRTRIHVEQGRARVSSIVLVGPQQRILDSVLPHEMTHAVFASYFPTPVPRWADEGASTMVEHASQRLQQERQVARILLSGQGVSVGRLFAEAEHTMNPDVLYVQGYSLTKFLLAHGGKQKFVQFLDDGVAGAAWDAALQSHYGIHDLQDLEAQWLAWAMPGL